MTNEAERVLITGPCRSRCKGGMRCKCTGSPHEIHICSDPHCYCHTPRAYGLTRTIQRNGTTMYVPVGSVE